MLVADEVRHRHPAGKCDRRVPGRQPAAQRSAPPRPRLRHDHEQDDEDKRRERQRRRRVPYAVENACPARPRGVLEDEVADADGGNRGDEDSARGNVLRELCVRIEARRREVDHALDRRVEHLGNEDERDREHERDQLQPCHPERDRGREDEDRSEEMEPEVPLRPEDVNDPLERVVEAVEQRRSTSRRRAAHA